jgi:heat-inducible transcriptional repressor
MSVSALSEREKAVLRYVIEQFILTANPVGSRYISKHYNLNLSPASIRNVLADLEYLGYIDHPHTSAGRVPTDKGYRFYVDSLLEYEQIPFRLKEEIKKKLKLSTTYTEEILSEASKILGAISKEVAIISSPQLSKGVFNKLDLIDITSSRIMVVISLKSGLVKTIIIEVNSEISRDNLQEVCSILNERLHGLTLEEIRKTFSERIKDVEPDKSGLVRIIIDRAELLFDEFPSSDRIHLSGTQSIFEQPEFINPQNIRTIIELIENKDIIIHILENREKEHEDVVITIGEENLNEKLLDYSFITSKYSVGDVSGIVGVMGPKRMDYSKMVALVNYFSKNISNLLVIK